MFIDSLKSLIAYCEKEEFKGYDPYDTLNSWFPFSWLDKWGSPVAIQIQKRNPINIRPLLGIKKGYNPKGMGLLLKVYSILYSKTKDKAYLERATYLFNWLKNNYSKGYSGYAWGYNFDWASPGSYLKAYTPSVVVTSFVTDGIFEYYKITNDSSAREILQSAASYVLNDIPCTEFSEGICFSYTHLSKGACYNASLLAAEILARADFVNKTSKHTATINRAIDFVLSKQKEDGAWWYSYDSVTNTERKQIDFHQGFVLVSLNNLIQLTDNPDVKVKQAIKKGLEFYRTNQFFDNGQSLWRIPHRWPTEIHNQSQGIITFSKLKEYNPEYYNFAKTVANWTIENMQSSQGYFYYRKNRLLTNKISYMRWSQAWMMLALTELIVNE